MPELVTITQELIDAYPHKNSGYLDIFHKKAIRCSLCMPPANDKQRHHQKLHLLRIGTKAVRVQFRNRTIGYYALKCWNKAENAERVQKILSRELKPKIES